ncbi:MAG: hypothetical protein H6514_01470 [Acidimicrobiaceae bacterium]|nr:hypothetical protein [Acidimicrobiaceae bacterium]
MRAPYRDVPTGSEVELTAAHGTRRGDRAGFLRFGVMFHVPPADELETGRLVRLAAV